MCIMCKIYEKKMGDDNITLYLCGVQATFFNSNANFKLVKDLCSDKFPKFPKSPID